MQLGLIVLDVDGGELGYRLRDAAYGFAGLPPMLPNMARAWTSSDELRWSGAINAASTALAGATATPDPPELRFRDIVAGSIRYLVAAVLHRLLLAARPPRSLVAEIEAARDSRAVAEWIAAPIEEPPLEVEVPAATDG